MLARDIVAPADHNWDYDNGNDCARCYEVACADGVIHDGYGNQLDRSAACYDLSASVIVQVREKPKALLASGLTQVPPAAGYRHMPL
jgi:hypothetical protein